VGYRPTTSIKDREINEYRSLLAEGVGLFEAPDDAKTQARMRTIDTLNGRFGRDTVAFSVTGKPRVWKVRSDMLSARYTTHWDELLQV
jgi:DNA polymerase V